MAEESGSRNGGSGEGQHWTQPAYVDPKIGETPPAGAVIGGHAVCRNCMTVAEEVTMRRGFIDPISAASAKEKDVVCSRCGARISGGP